MLVAVYGTLKKGYGNHSVISAHKLVGSDYLRISALEDCGFPCVKFNKDSNIKLFVELYEVNTEEGMNRLDSLEWVPTLYHRLYTKTVWGKDVCVYEYTDKLNGIDYNCLEQEWENDYKRVKEITGY